MNNNYNVPSEIYEEVVVPFVNVASVRYQNLTSDFILETLIKNVSKNGVVQVEQIKPVCSVLLTFFENFDNMKKSK